MTIPEPLLWTATGAVVVWLLAIALGKLDRFLSSDEYDDARKSQDWADMNEGGRDE